MTFAIESKSKIQLGVVPADSVEDVKESKISQMPEGLLDRLNESEVYNLLMYIMAGGDPEDKVYTRGW